MSRALREPVIHHSDQPALPNILEVSSQSSHSPAMSTGHPADLQAHPWKGGRPEALPTHRTGTSFRRPGATTEPARLKTNSQHNTQPFPRPIPQKPHSTSAHAVPPVHTPSVPETRRCLRNPALCSTWCGSVPQHVDRRWSSRSTVTSL